MHARSRVLAGCGAAALLATTWISPAVAATPVADGAAVTAAASNCSYSYPAPYSVYIANECDSGTIRVKAVISWGPDSPCHTLGPGQGFRYTWSIGSWDYAASC